MIFCRKFITLLFSLLLLAANGRAEETIKFPLPAPSTIGTEKFANMLNQFVQQESYLTWKHDLKARFTGPYIVHSSGEVESFGTHGPSAVQVYYSPEVWKWMQGGNKGLIPDGGTIIKVLFARNPDEPTKFSPDPTGFSIMVKDSKGSWDGWFYSDGGPLMKPTRGHALNFFDPNAGFALSCVNCHASAANPEGTFSSLRHINGEPIEHITQVSLEGMKKRVASNDIHNPVKLDTADKKAEWCCPTYVTPAVHNAIKTEPAPITFSAFDHVPQGPRPDGQKLFVTASNCSSCHDAVQLNSTKPNMAYYEKGENGGQVISNLSPHSEWRASMMGLSGRDPVFRAQLESEKALYPELADRIDHACLSCHTPMAQRQHAQDFGKDALFTIDLAKAEPGSAHEKYGALARDGVSCMVCHQTLPDGLGTPETYSGKFKLPEKSTQVFGPHEKLATLPMEQAVGLTPKHAPHMSDSKLCASCHTVKVPALDTGRKYTVKEFNDLMDAPGRGYHEQTTYLEWKNSAFSTEVAKPGPQAQSCQDCHMPRTYKNQPLKFKVANIEDDTFPPVDHRAPDDKIKLEPRDKYSRHALHGINLFVLEMFNQNPALLGVQRRDNLFPSAEVKSAFDLAIESGKQMATEQTAKVEILTARRQHKKLLALVQVTNLAGHKFPTGVAMRRAFLEFKIESGGKTIWASGATDKFGVIGTYKDGAFTALDTEFLKNNAFQPHHRTITREDQAQIYEELVADSKGDLTTSFLRLKNVVKDNRLQPQGWKADGPDADLTHSVGTGDDPSFRDGTGRDVVTYEVPLDVPENQPVSVSATLYYQSLPPYYLQQRLASSHMQAAQRLGYLVSHFEEKNTAIKDWKLKIAGDTKSLETK